MDVSVVIPTLNPQNSETIESLPPDVAEIIISDNPEGPAIARNDGIDKAKFNKIVLMDDDLIFEGEWFRDLVKYISPGTVRAAHGKGILNEVKWPKNFDVGMSRVMAFNKDVWQEVGGFVQSGFIEDDPDYGSDTDFLMSAWEEGYEIRLLTHEWEHVDEPDEYALWENIKWLMWLTKRHPRLMAPRLPAIFRAKVKS